MATARGACPGAVPRGHAIRDGNWHLDSAGAGDGSPGRGAAGAPPRPPPSAHETTLLSGSGPGQARPGQAKPGQAKARPVARITPRVRMAVTQASRSRR